MNIVFAVALAAILLASVGNLSLLALGAPGQVKLSSENKKFLAAKEQQARDLGKEFNEEISPDIWRFFRAAREGDYPATHDLVEQFQKRNSQYENAREDKTITVIAYQTVIEASCFLDFLAEAGSKYTALYGQEIIRVVPPGAIYFGGTDAGRGVVTALCKSHQEANPFFTLTQNALASGLYLKYVRSMYGKRLMLPSDEDSQKCFTEYLEDVQRRMKDKQLRPGEDVRIIENRVQASGLVAVMSINALLVKVIFDNNPKPEFFIEESFPLDWMYPHLSPAGPIMRLNRKPLESLTADVVRKDREYWDRLIQPMIGKWLREDTTVAAVCEFNQRIYADKNLAEFKGDPAFVDAAAAQKAFSKLRSSIGGLYAWWAQNATNATEKKRMTEAADFAFRQALALCPYSPEAVFRYINLCLAQQPTRVEDALAVARTCQKLDRTNQQVSDLVNRLEEMKEKGNQ